MLDTRETAYAQREPAVIRALDNVDLDLLDRRRLNYATRVSAIDEGSDYLALANVEEQSQYRRLQRAEKKLDSLPYSVEINELRENRRLLAGVLNWRLEAKYKERLWRQKKTLNDLDVALQDARQSSVKVAQARTEMPAKFVYYRQTINALRPRVKALMERTAILAEIQREYVQSLAIEELEAQKRRLYSYQVQARFALATIYDRAAIQELSP